MPKKQWMWSETQVTKNRVLNGNTQNVGNFIFYLTVHNNLDVQVAHDVQSQLEYTHTHQECPLSDNSN